ncbi:transcriptional regulator [Serratia marcescens]|uniref:transcriptional regulator n=1 Tax=Serratia marcescens TaxID=615 RepID=UPI0013DD5CB1|nr:winged helix-turn-helix domain-containing protein [Serratia marcescens]
MNFEKKIRIRSLDVLNLSGQKFRMRWKESQILSLLIARSPELVTRTEIIENIWKGTYCSDSTINQTIKSIRQKIGDVDHTIIRTIPRLGYKVENKSIFQFTEDTEELNNDETWNNTSIENESLQAEYSENTEEIEESDNDKMAKSDEEINAEAEHVASYLMAKNKTRKRHFSPRRRAFALSMPSRTLKVAICLLISLSILAISLFSYMLGNQARLIATNDIRNDTRVVLTLVLNEPGVNNGKVMICVYQGSNHDTAKMECADVNNPQFKKSVSGVPLSLSVGRADVLDAKYRNLKYQVYYDVGD